MATVQHNLLASDDLHVPWRIFAGDTARLAYTLDAADVGKLFYVQDTNEAWTVNITPAWVPILTPPRLAIIRDTALTAGSPLVLPADTPTQVTNNAGTGTFGINIDTADYWDTGTNRAIVPRPQWDYVLRLDYTLETTSNSAGRLVFTIDIGGAQGIIYTDTRALFRGVGVPQKGSFVFNGYAGTTWTANGAILRLESTVAAEVYDINVVVKPY